MKLEGSYTFDAPRDLVWEMFFEPEVLAKTMPGCEKLEMVGENSFEGRMRVQVGPVQGRFKGTVVLSDLQAPETYHMQVDGQGPSGFMKGEGDIRLEETDNGTVMHYVGDAQVGGRIAQVGQRLMESSARAIVKQSLDNLARQVEARHKPDTSEDNNEDEEGEPGEEPRAPTQTEFALGVAREMLGEYVPVEKQPQLIGSAVALIGAFVIIQLFMNWWADMLADRIAKNLRQKEV